jgi:hypothetical protein
MFEDNPTTHGCDDDHCVQSTVGTKGNIGNLCERCKSMEFGESLQDEVLTAAYRISRRILSFENLLPKDCKLCAQLAELRIPTSWPQMTYRYIPSSSPGHMDGVGARKSSCALIDKVLHFKSITSNGGLHDSASSGGGDHCQLHTFTQTLVPTPWSHDTSHRDIFSMEKADLRLAKIWYNYCRAQHPDICGYRLQREGPIPHFRVIDCISGRMCDARADQPYVALSYVWGDSGPDLLKSPSNSPADFPMTIQDAMLVAVELGVPYLWVDRHCIDQSNKQEKHSLISNMTSIYSGAELTIIAATGLDPHHGLPGISGTPRKGNTVMDINGGCLIECPDVCAEIGNHSWSTRGWT